MDFNNQPTPNNFAPTPRIPFRNIALCIIFSIITCGIYVYYWVYCLNEDLRMYLGNNNATSGGMVILLSIVTCGIYLFYWCYTQGEAIDYIKKQRGLMSGSLGILYLILAIFGLAIVAYAIMQNELNNLSKY